MKKSPLSVTFWIIPTQFLHLRSFVFKYLSHEKPKVSIIRGDNSTTLFLFSTFGVPQNTQWECVHGFGHKGQCDEETDSYLKQMSNMNSVTIPNSVYLKHFHGYHIRALTTINNNIHRLQRDASNMH